MATSSGQRTAVAIVAVVISFSIGPTVASTPPHDRPLSAAATLRADGLQLGYNLDHAAALAAFNDAIAADPTDPTPHRLAAAIAWIELLFEQGAITVEDYLGQARANLPRATPTAALDDAFHDALNEAIALSEERLRADSTDADAHYQAGAAYGYLATYTATIEGRLLGSLGAARRAYQEHQRTLELDPSRKDAGMVVGMYRYSIASLPMPLRLLARLAGFASDRARGLRMVEEAADYPGDAQANAQFALILIYNREGRYDDALAVIGKLQQRFPRNRLLWLEQGNTALRAGRPADANAAIEEGLERLSHDPRPRAQGEDARWRYAHGAALVALNRRIAAEAELRTALSVATRDWVRGRVRKELGKLADLAGDRPHALEQYRMAEGLCRQDHDGDCSDEVKKLMKAAYR